MEDKPKYGSEKQPWHPNFIKYMEFIANHPNYQGMPDAFVEGDKIQWEAPSNRQSGKYKDTHHKRRKWWQQKANSIGIDHNSAQWISKTARQIHPTKEKPCKQCGKVMELKYVYPNNNLLQRIEKLSYVDENFSLDSFERITDIITRLVETFGDCVFSDLPKLLKTKSISPPEMENDLNSWLEWIEQTYIESEPSLLSPGAMSNAPDRFEGFHSFNKCCRSKADKGRHPSNLQSYVTDRRVFEYWTEGDWIAANELMGKIRTKFKDEPCLNGHPAPCSADHIGPISLGFTHRPEFQLLCKSCNSAKNNRMTLADVSHLWQIETRGETVISWHSKALWDARKQDVIDDETALRLSKLLRDNRHTLMSILQQIYQNNYFTFLATFLELNYAEYDVEFLNLRVENHKTKFDDLKRTYRTTKYVEEQKARRCRVAFESLRDYFTKENRNVFVISSEDINIKINESLDELQKSDSQIQQLDQQINDLLSNPNQVSLDEGFKTLVSQIPTKEPTHFAIAKQKLTEAMALIAEQLSNLWEDDRYVRGDL